ncbi:MAG: branched-chain amino acid ABC transporter permease [Xanthobacteraceae bacterium]|nr:MAG: branched-chain amino acid ABC transporter permease [Xanthobacteraceae bacterium]
MKNSLSWLGFAALGAVGPLAAHFIPAGMTLSLLAQATFAAIFALGIGFLIRQNGTISFGHAAFFGLPGYAVAALLPLKLMPLEVLFAAALVGTVALAFAIGLVVVRVHGIAFGMLTLAIGQGLYEAATRWRAVTGGHDGMTLRLPREVFGLPVKLLQQPHGMFVAAWIVMTLCLVAVWLFARSPWGRLTEAIRDNEERVRFLGYRTLLPRAAVFAASALLVAIAGMLSVLYNAFISPDAIHWTASGSGLIMAILGGSAVAWGPLLGGFVYFFLKHAAGAYTTHWLSIIGVALILVAVAFPNGLAGLMIRQRSRP